ncbi:MAG: hypothetical protein V2B13_03560 [Pseudomonadota bacterium]
MKKHEVPQDDDGLLENKQLDLCYAVDEQGNYVTVPSYGWAPKNAALLQAWEVIHGKMEAARQQILQGRLSPIAYYMEKNIMDVKLLATFIGLPKWKVRRHLKPAGFEKLDEMTLGRYADIFHVSLEALTDFRETAEEK